jgi:quercetin dioxygenase-like cupin family protein
VQKGCVNFVLEAETFLLEEGALFTFKAFQKHSVTALKDSSLLIVK